MNQIYIIIIYVLAFIAFTLLAQLISGFLKFSKAATRCVEFIAIISAFILLKVYFVPIYIEYIVGLEIKNQYPILNTVYKIDPDGYKHLIKKLTDTQNINNKKNYTNHIIINSSLLIQNTLYKSFEKASNKSIHNYMVISNDINKKIFKTNPALVVKREAGFAYTQNNFFESDYIVSMQEIDKTLSNKDKEKLLSAANMVMKTSISESSQVLTDSEFQNSLPIIESIISELAIKYGNNILSNSLTNPHNPSLNKETTARIFIDMYDKIIALGPEKSGAVFKTLSKIGDS